MCSEQRQDLSPPGCRISLKPFWWPTSCGSHGGCSCTWGFLGLWVAPLSSANPAPPRLCWGFPPNLTPPNSAGFLLFPLSFPPHTLLLNTLRFWRGELSILHLSLTAEVHTDCIQHGWAPDLALPEEMLPHRVPGSSWWWGMLLAPPTAHPGSSWSSGRGSAWRLGCCLAAAHSSGSAPATRPVGSAGGKWKIGFPHQTQLYHSSFYFYQKIGAFHMRLLLLFLL